MGFFTTWVVLMLTTAGVSALATATQGVGLAARTGGFSVQRGSAVAPERSAMNARAPPMINNTAMTNGQDFTQGNFRI
jgi:hypothetical protein